MLSAAARGKLRTTAALCTALALVLAASTPAARAADAPPGYVARYAIGYPTQQVVAYAPAAAAVYPAPAYPAPAYQAPRAANYQAPAYGAPVNQVVNYQAPAYQAPAYQAPIAAPVYRPAPPRNTDYNPVGFGFGGYSYGGYPAYGFNGNLPAAYEGFNPVQYSGNAARTMTGYRGAPAQPMPAGYSQFNMSDAWTGYCGPNGCRMNYRAY